MQATDHRKGKGCQAMTLIGSIAGRGAAGTLFVVRGPTGCVPRGNRRCGSKQGVTTSQAT